MGETLWRAVAHLQSFQPGLVPTSRITGSDPDRTGVEARQTGQLLTSAFVRSLVSLSFRSAVG